MPGGPQYWVSCRKKDGEGENIRKRLFYLIESYLHSLDIPAPYFVLAACKLTYVDCWYTETGVHTLWVDCLLGYKLFGLLIILGLYSDIQWLRDKNIVGVILDNFVLKSLLCNNPVKFVILYIYYSSLFCYHVYLWWIKLIKSLLREQLLVIKYMYIYEEYLLTCFNRSIIWHRTLS